MDMPKQEKAERRSTRDTEVDESVSTTSEAPGASSLNSDVDSILDEVLEVNAEDFVKSFVQKGGQ